MQLIGTGLLIFRDISNNVPNLPGIDYVAKNWALAMMSKALPLVHFWSVLLLKEQMMTSVRKTLKTQNTDRYLTKFSLKRNHKIGLFYRLIFGEVCLKHSRESAAKSADFSANLPQKIARNLTFFRYLSEAQHCFARSIRFENTVKSV